MNAATKPNLRRELKQLKENIMPMEPEQVRLWLAHRLPDSIIRAVRSHQKSGGTVRVVRCEPGRYCLWMVEFLHGERVALFSDRVEYYGTQWGNRFGQRVYFPTRFLTFERLKPRRPEDLKHALAALAKAEFKRKSPSWRRVETDTPPATQPYLWRIPTSKGAADGNRH